VLALAADEPTQGARWPVEGSYEVENIWEETRADFSETNFRVRVALRPGSMRFAHRTRFAVSAHAGDDPSRELACG